MTPKKIAQWMEQALTRSQCSAMVWRQEVWLHYVGLNRIRIEQIKTLSKICDEQGLVFALLRTGYIFCAKANEHYAILDMQHPFHTKRFEITGEIELRGATRSVVLRGMRGANSVLLLNEQGQPANVPIRINQS